MRLYSRRSFVASGPTTLPQPAKGTTIAVALSSPPNSSEKDRIRSAAVLGSGASLARSTISASDNIDDIPSDTKTINAHSFPERTLVKCMRGKTNNPPLSNLVRTSGSGVTPNRLYLKSPKLQGNF